MLLKKVFYKILNLKIFIMLYFYKLLKIFCVIIIFMFYFYSDYYILNALNITRYPIIIIVL